MRREQEGDPEAAAKVLPFATSGCPHHEVLLEAPALMLSDHVVRLQSWLSATENELSLGLLLEPSAQ